AVVFSGSILSLQHSDKEGTAVTLADRQLEAYRSLPTTCLPFTTSAGATAPSNPDTTNCTTPSSFPNPYAGTQNPTASDTPDHHSYTVTTTIKCVTVPCSTTTATSTIQAQVTVTESGKTTVLAQEISDFSPAGSTSN